MKEPSMESKLTNLENRLKDVEDKTENKIWVTLVSTILPALIGAIFALGGTWISSELTEKNLKLQSDKLIAEQLKSIEGQDAYEKKQQMIHNIYNAHGIEKTLAYENAYRSGATIRALEEILERTETETEKERIKDSLDSAKKVLFIDSTAPNNLYCHDPDVQSSRTNIDDIVHIIKDDPIGITAKKGDKEGKEGIIKFIEKNENYPDIIVMHLGGFEKETEKTTKDVDQVKDFLTEVYELKKGDKPYRPSVILYSRSTNFNKLEQVKNHFFNSKHKEDKDNSSVSESLTLVRMELNNPNNQNSDCFKIEFKNGKRITRVIRETINIGELYNR